MQDAPAHTSKGRTEQEVFSFFFSFVNLKYLGGVTGQAKKNRVLFWRKRSEEGQTAKGELSAEA